MKLPSFLSKRELFLRLIALVGWLGIGWLYWQLHHYTAQDYAPPGVGPDVQAQLTSIGRALRAGAGEATQAWYPEGYFFSHALYGLALVNQALLTPNDSALWARNAAEVEWVLQQLESESGRAPFPPNQAVPHGVFYLGWHNRLLAGLLLLQSAAGRDPAREAQFHAQTELLAQAFAQSPTHYLEAYPGQSWPVDNVVALTSLSLHDDLYHTQYTLVVADWLTYTRAHLDPATGLIPHHIDAVTGEHLQGARGSSQVLMLSFLPELDPVFAQAQYTSFRAQYAQPFLDFVFIREYPHGVRGPMDVDSGPLVFDLGPVASGVSLLPARVNGDVETFERMVQLSEVLGLPLTWGDEKRLALGQLVVGEAFLVLGKTQLNWRGGGQLPPSTNYPRLTSPWYPWTNGIAIGLILLIEVVLWWARRK